MFRVIAVLISLTLLFLFQQAFLAAVFPFGIVPNLVLAGLAAWVALEDDPLALLWAVAGGVLLDLFSPDLFGLHALLLLLATWLLFVLRDRVLASRSRFAHISFTLAGSLPVLAGSSLVRIALSPFVPAVATPMSDITLLLFLVATLLLTVAASFLFQPFFRRLHDLFQTIEQRRSRLRQSF